MVVLADGKGISQKIQNNLKEYVDQLSDPLSFHIIYLGSDPVIDNFIKYKKEFGEAIGVDVVVHRYDSNLSEVTIIKEIKEISAHASGVIVQLPLPEHLDRDTILNAVPTDKDIDVLGSVSRELFSLGTTLVLPPVTGAIVEIFNYYHIDLKNKNILLIGNGTLVGYPMSLWLKREGYEYHTIDHNTQESERAQLLQQADIIISGAGVPHMIRPENITEGVILIDAGTSEAGKKIIGDIHPDCMKKAQLMTPVPGGIGPITIGILYQNLIHLSLSHHD